MNKMKLAIFIDDCRHVLGFIILLTYFILSSKFDIQFAYSIVITLFTCLYPLFFIASDYRMARYQRKSLVSVKYRIFQSIIFLLLGVTVYYSNYWESFIGVLIYGVVALVIFMMFNKKIYKIQGFEYVDE